MLCHFWLVCFCHVRGVSVEAVNLCEQFRIYFIFCWGCVGRGWGWSKICFSRTYTRPGYFLPHVECVHNSSSTNDAISVVLGVSHQNKSMSVRLLQTVQQQAMWPNWVGHTAERKYHAPRGKIQDHTYWWFSGSLKMLAHCCLSCALVEPSKRK